MSVTIDSGQFPLMRNVDVGHQPSRAKVYTAWTTAFNYRVPDAVDHLADIVEDTYVYELWKDKYLATPEKFFERMGILGLDLENPAKLIKALRSKRSPTKAKFIARAEKAIALREQGLTQQAIADELGVSQPTISDHLSGKRVQTQKADKAPRKVTQYTVTQYTTPETAALKIREKFGDEWAQKLVGQFTPAHDENEPPALSMTAKQREEASIRAHKKKLDREYWSRMQEEIQKQLEDTILPDYRKRSEEHTRVVNAYRGVFTTTDYKMLIGVLHTDRYQELWDKDEADVRKTRMARAFDLLQQKRLELCGVEDEPRVSTLPKTLADLMAMRKTKW